MEPLGTSRSVRFDLAIGTIARGGMTFDPADCAGMLSMLLALIDLEGASVTVRKAAPHHTPQRHDSISGGQDHVPAHLRCCRGDCGNCVLDAPPEAAASPRKRRRSMPHPSLAA